MNRRRRVGMMFAGVLAASVAPGSLAQQTPGDAPVPEVAPYQRIVESKDGSVVSLEMAVREFAPSKEGQPRVFLAGAVHIADRDFYQKLQAFLDAKDLVLFEGVKPPGAGGEGPEAPTDAAKRDTTKRQLRFLAMAVAWYSADHGGTLPADLQELATGSDRRTISLLKGSLKDGWGRAIEYIPAPAAPADEGGNVSTPSAAAPSAARKFDLVSLGSDGRSGGEGDAADLKFSDQKPLTKSELGDRSDGIQSQLAKSMGLVFQLDAMDHDKPNWRNSDMSVDQVQARLEKSGANADGLFKMLDGSSMFGKLAGVLLGMMGSSPESRAMLRLMMIEMLGRADALMGQMPGNMGKVMEVILHDRNAVVIADLKAAVDAANKQKTIAVIYGAAHLPGIQSALVAQMGYTPVADSWRAAMNVDAKAAGMTGDQLKQMRKMMAGMIDRQLKQMPVKKQPAK